MNSTTFWSDTQRTIENRADLQKKPNLLYWYRELYSKAFAGMENLEQMKILEIGSGMSPLHHYYPSVITSDVMPLDYVDLVFDAHEIDTVSAIADGSLDCITFTNVLHHLKEPLGFLERAHAKLKPSGCILAIEPYYSFLSKPIYCFLHHEPSDYSVTSPRLSFVDGPLSTANQVMSHLLFFERREWAEPLRRYYDWPDSEVRFFSSLSYMMSGGISRKIPIPHFLYRSLFSVDNYLANVFPRALASFFILTLRRKPGAEVGSCNV